MSGKALAEKLGLHQTAVSRILLGDRSPSRETSLALEVECGIPIESWSVRAPRRKRAPRFRRVNGGR